jgi:two-component system sensor histidine kinase UhpB
MATSLHKGVVGSGGVALSGPALGGWLLRMPLFYKILLANSAIVALGAVGGTLITIWHVLSFPHDLHYELIAFFGGVGLTISFAVNFLVLRVTLKPLDHLQEGVDQVQSGSLKVRIPQMRVSDERFDRLISTFNQMLETLEQDAQQLHSLSGAILQAQEEERQRVARELHDDAAQALTSLLVRLRLLERSERPEEARLHVRELRELTAGALEEVRRVALELRPTILDDLGLEAALGWRVDELNASHSTRVDLKVVGIEARLPRDLELVFYRVAQEALNNVARHSHARYASVTLAQEQGCLTLCIEDDGVGFDPARSQALRPHGLGLVGMRERLSLVGGRLSIESRAGGGTRLVARAPLAKPSTNGVSHAEDTRAAG